MQARGQPPVRPALQRLAHIHNHLARVVGPDPDESIPATHAVLELEPAGAVLEEQRDDAEVEVRPDAADGARLQLGDVDGRVVVQAQLAGGGGARDEAVEGAGGDGEGGFERGEYVRGGALEGGEGLFHEGAEAGEGAFGGPAGGELRV